MKIMVVLALRCLQEPNTWHRSGQACCIIYDFSSERELKGKEMKRQTLLELVEYASGPKMTSKCLRSWVIRSKRDASGQGHSGFEVNSSRTAFQDSLIPEVRAKISVSASIQVVKMVGANIFRALQPKDGPLVKVIRCATSLGVALNHTTWMMMMMM